VSLQELNPDTGTHPSTNRAQRRLTPLIKTNALSLCQTATYYAKPWWMKKESGQATG